MDKRLADIIKATEVVEVVGSMDIAVDNIVLDSRKAVGGSLFVAQKGANVDGHSYIPQVFAQGCKAVVCEQMPADIPSDVCVVKIADTHATLGHIASRFYDEPSKALKLVGVTGTNGKTTIATLLYRLVRQMGDKAGLFSTVANYVGDERLATINTTPDAITLHSLMRKMVDEGCEYCFMEVSSHSVVQQRIAGLDFDGGVFTNLTHDHLDYHGTFDEYRRAKQLFFDGLKPEAFALTNDDDRNGNIMIQNSRAKRCSYSLRTMATYKGEVIEHGFEGMLMKFDGREAFMQFVGRFNASNLLAIYGAALSLGFEAEQVLVALSALVPVDGRFETLRSADGKTAIVDYAHTPDALKNVITTINDIRKGEQQLITVCGCGGNRDKTKRPEMAREAVEGSNIVILTSDNPRNEDPMDILADMKAGLTGDEEALVLTIPDRREAIATALKMAKSGDIVLIAGKGHEDYQEIKGVKHHFDDREEVTKAFNK